MQAARLASRLQRELKMLQTDPPPGVCAWPCNDQLTLLEAQIQGPEGTVYSKGIFKLEVQVPERYPFEPPNLRFVTPIYHPNIDTGGRICLDILNMPPKGAWRPSLNLATVLASIGLLLAEPNADDGLMGDITAEFKHNRSSFDLKAINWTKQYATQEQAVHKTLANCDSLQVGMSQKTTLDKDNSFSMLAELHQTTDSSNNTPHQIVMAEINSKSYKDKNLFPVNNVNMSNSMLLPVDALKSSSPDRKTLFGDVKLCERGKLRLRREVSDRPYTNSFNVSEQDDGVKDRQSSLISRPKSFKLPKTKEGLQDSVAESTYHFDAEKYCKHADVNNQPSVAISEAQHGIVTVIVSDSESDDELSETQSRLSLTQRSLIGKRKVSSKLR